MKVSGFSKPLQTKDTGPQRGENDIARPMFPKIC